MVKCLGFLCLIAANYTENGGHETTCLIALREFDMGYLQYSFLMRRFNPLSQNVLDRISGYFKQTRITTKEHTPRVIMPKMAPASSAAGTENIQK